MPNSRPISSTLGYTIDAPVEWSVNQELQTIKRADLVLQGPENPDGAERDDITVVTQDLARNMSAKEFGDEYRILLQDRIPGFASQAPVDASAAGVDRCKMVCTAFGQGIKMKACYYFIIQKMKCYLVECSSSDENFEQKVPLFDEIGYSFRFDKTP